jgi:6-phosphogluconate dehydrogenase
MVHNGIEHGMMSAICEAWGIMRKMGMGYEEIGNVFKEWNSSGELVSLVSTIDRRAHH